MVMGYEMFGKGVELPGVYRREPDTRKLDLSVDWCAEVQKPLDQGILRCHPPKEVGGKWDGILEGLEMIKRGEVRGVKLVVRVGE